MSSIHAITTALIIIFLTGRVSPPFNVAFDPSFAPIYVIDGNILLPSHCQSMCGFIKVNKSVSVNSEQQDPSTTFIFALNQGHTTSENDP